MRVWFRGFALSCLLLAPPGLFAQEEAGPQALTMGPSGQAYLDAIRFRGLDTDVAYYDPSRAAPELETGAEPPPKRKPGGPAAELEDFYFWRNIVAAVAVAILIGLAVLILRNSGSFTLSFQSDVENAARTRPSSKPLARAMDGPPADLQAILRTSDRKAALVMLAQAALARTVAANGVLIQPSWTLRDALRHIPRGQSHLDALRTLVLAGERVLFGNRDVTEAEFQALVASVRPLMGQGA